MSEDADAEKGLISTTSPIGRALINKAVGDEVEVTTPNGKRRFEIIGLKTIHDVDGANVGALVSKPYLISLNTSPSVKDRTPSQISLLLHSQPCAVISVRGGSSLLTSSVLQILSTTLGMDEQSAFPVGAQRNSNRN